MINGKIKRKLYFMAGGILSKINVWIPKNPNKILFFSTTGLYDNSEALFDYLIEHNYNKKYTIVCAVRNPSIYKKSRLRNVRFISVFLSIPQLLASRYIFYHNEMLAIMPSPSQVSIDFWHAATFKKINKMLDKGQDYQYNFFTYITATSQLFRPVFAEAFGCRLDQVIINGQPRNDYLFGDFNELPKLGITEKKYFKIFFWFPTYRISYNRKMIDTSKSKINDTGIPILKTREDMEALNRFLKQNNALLFIKIHPAQLTEGYDFSDMSNLRFLFNAQLEQLGIRLYRLLKEADALVTDYSSVFFDYLLLDRPIGFTIDDIDSYGRHRGFVFDNPLDYMPGEKIYTQKDFYTFLNHCLNNTDNYHKEREQVNNLVNFYQDGGNRKRILDFAGVHL